MLFNFVCKLFGKHLLTYFQELHAPTFKAELERPIPHKENEYTGDLNQTIFIFTLS